MNTFNITNGLLGTKIGALGQKSKYGEIKQALSSIPTYSTRSSISEYEKQLVETRTLIYHQQNLRMLSKEELTDPVEKKNFIVKKVARELWTNFCVRGQETPMLKYLHESLRKEYGDDLDFYYIPGSIELVIMKQGENGMEAVDRVDQINMVNTAWRISQEVVSSYMIH